jgi:hypothetical protein
VASVLAESVSMSDAWSGAKKFRVTTSLGGMSTAVHAAVFEVGALSFVLCHLHLLKPSSWVAVDFGVLDWPAGVLAFSTAFNSCTVTVYVPYRALNRFFPLRTLQKFCLFSSAVLTMDDHYSLSPTEAGVYLAISSMSRIILTGVSAVHRRQEIVLLVVGTLTLTCYMCPSKMPDIPALGCEPSLA